MRPQPLNFNHICPVPPFRPPQVSPVSPVSRPLLPLPNVPLIPRPAPKQAVPPLPKFLKPAPTPRPKRSATARLIIEHDSELFRFLDDPHKIRLLYNDAIDGRSLKSVYNLVNKYTDVLNDFVCQNEKLILREDYTSAKLKYYIELFRDSCGYFMNLIDGSNFKRQSEVLPESNVNVGKFSDRTTPVLPPQLNFTSSIGSGHCREEVEKNASQQIDFARVVAKLEESYKVYRKMIKYFDASGIKVVYHREISSTSSSDSQENLPTGRTEMFYHERLDTVRREGITSPPDSTLRHDDHAGRTNFQRLGGYIRSSSR